MSRDLKRQLKSLRHAPVNPRSEWVLKTRALLVSQVRNTLPLEQPGVFLRMKNITEQIFSPQLFFRPVAVVLAFVMMISGWVATSKASFESLPGDTLYAVKIAGEKTQLAWVAVLNNQAQSAQFHLELANRRADEVKKIFATPGKRSRAPEVVDGVKQELTVVNQKLADISAGSSAQLSPAVVDDLRKQTNDLRISLQEVKVNLQSATTTADKMLSEQVTEVRNLTKDAGVATAQVAVADHLKEHSAITKDYVNSLLDTTLNNVVVEAGETRGSVADVKTLVAEAAQGALESSKNVILPTSSLVRESSTTSVSTSTPASTTSVSVQTTSTVQQIKETLSNVASEATKGVIQTQVAADDLTKKANEAKVFLSTGDLAQAVSKIKEVSEASKEVEKITDATIGQVQANLPDIQVSEGKAISSTTTISSTVFLKDKIDSLLRSSGLATTSSAVESVSSTSVSSTPSSSPVVNVIIVPLPSSSKK